MGERSKAVAVPERVRTPMDVENAPLRHGEARSKERTDEGRRFRPMDRAQGGHKDAIEPLIRAGAETGKPWGCKGRSG